MGVQARGPTWQPPFLGFSRPALPWGATQGQFGAVLKVSGVSEQVGRHADGMG